MSKQLTAEDFTTYELLQALAKRHIGYVTEKGDKKEFVSPHKIRCFGLDDDHVAELILTKEAEASLFDK